MKSQVMCKTVDEAKEMLKTFLNIREEIINQIDEMEKRKTSLEMQLSEIIARIDKAEKFIASMKNPISAEPAYKEA